MLGRLTDTIGALWVLLTLGVVTKFRFNGDYWQWRTHTALHAKGAPEGVCPLGVAHASAALSSGED